jgi:hypothetical protein
MTESNVDIIKSGSTIAVASDAPPAPMRPDMASKIKFPKCPHCRRRPTLRAVPGQFVEVPAPTPDNPEAKTTMPKYEMLRCCSAKYIKTIEHVSRRQMRQLLDQAAVERAHPKMPQKANEALKKIRESNPESDRQTR